MTIAEVAERVNALRRDVGTKGDEEDWHFHEDAIWHDVLLAISQGSEDARYLAREALKTGEIEFSRWYA